MKSEKKALIETIELLRNRYEITMKNFEFLERKREEVRKALKDVSGSPLTAFEDYEALVNDMCEDIVKTSKVIVQLEKKIQNLSSE